MRKMSTYLRHKHDVAMAANFNKMKKVKINPDAEIRQSALFLARRIVDAKSLRTF